MNCRDYADKDCVSDFYSDYIIAFQRSMINEAIFDRRCRYTGTQARKRKCSERWNEREREREIYYAPRSLHTQSAFSFLLLCLRMSVEQCTAEKKMEMLQLDSALVILNWLVGKDDAFFFLFADLAQRREFCYFCRLIIDCLQH